MQSIVCIGGNYGKDTSYIIGDLHIFRSSGSNLVANHRFVLFGLSSFRT